MQLGFSGRFEGFFILFGKIKKNMDNFSRCSLCLSRGSNQECSEYKRQQTFDRLIAVMMEAVSISETFVNFPPDYTA